MKGIQHEPLKTLTCINGIVELYSDCIVIYKKGFFAHLLLSFASDKQVVSLYHLLEVKLYLGPVLSNGVLRLITPEGNLFMFFGHQNFRQAQEMKDTIEDLMSRQRVFSEIHKKLRRT